MFKRKEEGGISLVEIIAAIAVLGILAAIAIGAYGRYREKAIETQELSELRSLAVEVNDTRARTMTPSGYAYTYQLLTADQIRPNLDEQQFRFVQYIYNGNTRQVKTVDKKLADATPANAVRAERVCITIAKYKDGLVYDTTHSAVFDGSAYSGKVYKGVCPYTFTHTKPLG